ncbi:hypothetical protein K1T71_000610 [Dendrolimus kikuchii]|uniref:Uncharacterized protein n=1 Tax=Dendrolimus kikuchii TaxID=765133 RepID=A0ACC1DJV8_9NEOP|nr:hypothetical protein K1T71_000610 [Dendrolimus kikuchii]
MGLADTCRVCLTGQKRLHAISNTLFQEIWEKLTNAKFNTNDGKSLLVCYICCAQLRRSHQLMKRASEAEKLLSAIVNNGSEQSQNALLLIASQTFGLDYKCVIEHLDPLDYTPFVRNTVQEIKKEKESEEDNEEGTVINIKKEEEESSQEDNLENADVESDTHSEYNTLLKPKLEREVQIVLERIDTDASARKRTIKEEPLNAKRIKFEETTQNINPLTDDVLEESCQEDNLENADFESDTPSEYNTLLKPKLEKEVQIVLERINTGGVDKVNI